MNRSQRISQLGSFNIQLDLQFRQNDVFLRCPWRPISNMSMLNEFKWQIIPTLISVFELAWNLSLCLSLFYHIQHYSVFIVEHSIEYKIIRWDSVASTNILHR